jgi:hypothetical protein
MPDEKIYRTAYIVQNTGHDFQELLKVCDQLKFISNGYEAENEALDTLLTGLQGFESEKDLIVPVGNVTLNLLLGSLLPKLCEVTQFFNMAVFYEKQYHFKVVSFKGLSYTVMSGALNVKKS